MNVSPDSDLNLSGLAPGDIVLRELVGEPMKLAYIGTRAGLIYAGFGPDFYWTFDLATGAEVDDDLSWGPAYGRTGSYLVGIEPQDPAVDIEKVLEVWMELTAKLDAA